MLEATSFVHRSGVLYLVVQVPDSWPAAMVVEAAATDIFGEVRAAGPAVVLDAAGVRRLRVLVLALGGGDGAGR